MSDKKREFSLKIFFSSFGILFKLLANDRFNLFIVFLIAICIRLPLYHTPYWRTYDADEYINIARNIASGQGFTQSFKTRFYNNDPVVTSAFHGRTSLLTLLLAGIILAGGNEYSMQLFIFLLCAINACLVYILCRRFISAKWSFIGGLLAAINPNILIDSRLILSEPLSSTFILLALTAILYMHERIRKYVIAGVFTALAYLTRTEEIIFLPLIAATAVKTPKRIIKAGVLIASFAIVSLPFFYGNYLVNGNPFYSHHTTHYSVRDYSVYDNYGLKFPTPITFLRNNFFWVLHKEKDVFIYLLKSLIAPDFFGPILFMLLLVFLKSTWEKFKTIYIYSLIILLVYTSLWAGIFEPSRHFTTVYLLLLVPLTYILQKIRKSPIVWIILILTFLTYGTYDIHRIAWARNIDPYLDVWSKPIKIPVYAWIEHHTYSNDIISSTSPQLIYLRTHRPGIQTPNNLNKDNYASFISRFHVKYFLVETSSISNIALLNLMANPKAKFPDSVIYTVR